MNIETQEAIPMKLFRLPNGLSVWNGPRSGTDTRTLYREIFEGHCYEKHGIAVRDGDVIFDVGANIGMFALSLLKRFRGLHMYCLEPVPSTYACMVRNVMESPLRTGHNVTPLKLAFGRADGESTIEFFPEAPSNSTLFSAPKHRDFGRILEDMRFADLWRTNKARAIMFLPFFPFRRRLLGPWFERIMAGGVSFPCSVRTLSSIVREHRIGRIDLLKVDVEGAEMDVLAGIEDLHWPLIRQLALEIEPANKQHLPAVVQRLRSFGFDTVEVESLFGGVCNPDDAVACTVYAVRTLRN